MVKKKPEYETTFKAVSFWGQRGANPKSPRGLGRFVIRRRIADILDMFVTPPRQRGALENSAAQA